jgi:hypothetical protein
VVYLIGCTIWIAVLASLMNATIVMVVQFVRTASVCKVSHVWVILPNRKSWVRGIIIFRCGHSLSLIHIVVFLIELIKVSDPCKGRYQRQHWSLIQFR